ncbi:MAG: amidohydrolase [Bacteroidia bacterium]|nr:amidohydrolase [Bacteroidia bacterium]MCZ2248406.1 amidohydrolase [Bacteroidia bacterium]
MSNLAVSIIQTSLAWHNREANLLRIEELINKINTPTQLIVLPEMFSSGFTMEPHKVADTPNGEVTQWMQLMAAKKKAVITGSVVVHDNGKYYNRLLWVLPDGTSLQYDKRHLFRMANENSFYDSGNSKLIATINKWTICPLVCYDLRFPVWSRNFSSKNNTNSPLYDVLIYVASWPEVRSHAWKSLLVARAIENQCYVIGVNRVGTDGNNITYSGDSVIIDPLGKVISNILPNEENTETLSLDFDYLNKLRSTFPVINDADSFTIE